jgi:hypothetical protein
MRRSVWVPALLLIKKNNSGIGSTDWKRGEICSLYETTDPLGAGELDTSFFVRFEITDKTVAEMRTYLSKYDRDIEYTLINAGPPRRYEVNNKNANSEGLGFWTLEATAAIKEDWEVDHPAADITTIGYPNTGVNGLGNIWDMSGVFAPGEGAEFQATVIEEGLNQMDKRTIWYISPAMMTAIENNGGFLSGNTSQLGPNLKDARLD